MKARAQAQDEGTGAVIAFLVHRQPSFCCSLTWWAGEGALRVLFSKGPNPITRTPPLQPDHLLMPPHWGSSFDMNSEGTNSVHNRPLGLPSAQAGAQGPWKGFCPSHPAPGASLSVLTQEPTHFHFPWLHRWPQWSPSLPGSAHTRVSVNTQDFLPSVPVLLGRALQGMCERLSRNGEELYRASESAHSKISTFKRLMS